MCLGSDWSLLCRGLARTIATAPLLEYLIINNKASRLFVVRYFGVRVNIVDIFAVENGVCLNSLDNALAPFFSSKANDQLVVVKRGQEKVRGSRVIELREGKGDIRGVGLFVKSRCANSAVDR